MLNLSSRLEIQCYTTYLSMNNHPHNHMVCLTLNRSGFFVGHQVRLQGQGRAWGKGGSLAYGEQKWKIDILDEYFWVFFPWLSMANDHITGFLMLYRHCLSDHCFRRVLSPLLSKSHSLVYFISCFWTERNSGR